MTKVRTFGARSKKNKPTAKGVAAKRKLVLESLEDRRLMATDINGLYYPPIGRATAYLPPTITAAQYAQRSIQQYGDPLSNGSSGGRSSPSGENNAPFSTSEIEPNNVRNQAQVLPLGTLPTQNNIVIVSGQTFNNVANNIYDEDYFAVDLRAGDILDIGLNSGVSGTWDVALLDASGSEVMGSTINASTLYYPPTSPLVDTTSEAALALTITATGRYFIRVSDGNNAYSMRLRAQRNSIESEPIGTKQILYLDFDGSIINPAVFGGPALTSRLPSLIETLEPFGFTAADENDLINKIIAKVREDFIGSLPATGGNGYFGQDGRAGAFDIDIRNSRDHADPWGQPNVSRVLVGGSVAEFPIATIGIAQSVDVGNFDRRESAVVMPAEIFFPLDTDAAILAANDARFIPRTATSTLSDMVSTALALIISHEAGHFFGGKHQDSSNLNRQTMDSGSGPFSQTLFSVGPDGIFGTPDDVDIDFGRDRYSRVEPYTGFVNHAGTMAFNLATGTVGATVTGVNFNDANRNGRQDSNDVGLAGWTIYADINGNAVFDSGDTSTVTGANGSYSLRVPAGTFNIRSVLQTGWVSTAPVNGFTRVTVASGQTASVNFGANRPTTTSTGFKWNDLNGDGIRDNGEPTLSGVYVYLDLDGDDRPDLGEPSSITAADGTYKLTPPSAGVYTIREVVEPGFVQTYPGPASSFEFVVNYDGVNPLAGYNFGNFESSDWGDAPAPYPTTRAANGAYHGQSPNLRLGTNWDSEQDGRPSANATGDDTNGPLGISGSVVDDEDGVLVLAPIVRGDRSNLIQVNITNSDGSSAFLQGWIDFNGNGTWESGEQIATDVPASNGPMNITFTTPANAVSTAFARFRLSQDRGLQPTGRSTTGEVEDYAFTIVDGPRTLLQPDTFTVARNSLLNPLDVLANDFQLPNDPWRITAVSVGSNGGRVVIDSTGRGLLYSPALSFVGRETFTYTATSTSGRRETTTVSTNVILQFVDPVAVDDSFDLPTNSTGFPLNVLVNDVEGRGGALVVSSVTNPDKGGAVTIGSGGQSIRYTPRRGFGGTETFRYTATDATGKTTTANITVHTLQADRLDDDVAFTFEFRNLAGDRITEIKQGEVFEVITFVDDLRPEKGVAETPPRIVTSPGVYSAYLDVLYSSGLVTPLAPTGGEFDFDVTFFDPYLSGTTGAAGVPGLINEFGGFIGNVQSFNRPNAVAVAKMRFTASSAGIAEFVGDPADDLPNSEITFYNTPTTRVPVEQVRYGRSTLEIVPNGVNFPFAVDDTRFNLVAATSFNIDVLTNDITGTQPPIRLTSVTQPINGQVNINTNNTPNNFADDTVTYASNTGFVGVDQFTYTIVDDRGFRSTATVTVHVGNGTADDIIQLKLKVTDTTGAELEQVRVGDTFQLRGYVEDVRTVAARFGVFAAFQDILYNSQLVSVNTSTNQLGFAVAFDPLYNPVDPITGQAIISGDIRIPGLINELGSIQADQSTPVGRGEKLQWVVTLQAKAVGTASFLGDPADVKPFHDSLVFDPTTPLTPNQIRYLSDSVVITAATGGTGGTGGSGGSGEGFMNSSNPYDVNNDGFVSPIDVLILVNSMNTGGSGFLGGGSSGGASGESGANGYYLDVNGDSYLSPLDALLVINHLNNRGGTSAGEGEGASSISSPAIDDKDSENPSYLVIDTPFLKKRTSSGFDFAAMGPRLSTEKSDDFESLADYLSSAGSDDSEMDYLDGIASDVFKNS